MDKFLETRSTQNPMTGNYINAMLRYFILVLLLTSVSSLHAFDEDFPILEDGSPFDEELTRLLVEEMNGLWRDEADITDEEYRSRFSALSGDIEYKLTKEIKDRILLRTVKYRSSTERLLGMSEMYFPVFEEHLASYNISHHLKYLPIVESHLNPVAKSRAKAVGLWQFIRPTGLLYGLKISSNLDERSDTHKASNAAARMLSELYKRYGDWPLALAAYNCGPGRVDKIIAKREKSYWKVRKYLPKETQMYVPYFMAVAYVCEYAEKHKLKPKRKHQDLVLTDSIHLEQGYYKLSSLARTYKIGYDTLKALNPGYKKGYVPSTVKQPILVLPARIVARERGCMAAYKRVKSFEKKENPIKCIRRIQDKKDIAFYMKAHRFNLNDLFIWNQLPRNYVFKKGDVIIIRQFAPIEDGVKEVRREVRDIAIPSLKVIGLGGDNKLALTAPVYVNRAKVAKTARRKVEQDHFLSRSRGRRLRPFVPSGYVAPKATKNLSFAASGKLIQPKASVIAAVPSAEQISKVEAEQTLEIATINLNEKQKAYQRIKNKEAAVKDKRSADEFLVTTLNSFDAEEKAVEVKKPAKEVNKVTVSRPLVAEVSTAVVPLVRSRKRNLRESTLEGKVSAKGLELTRSSTESKAVEEKEKVIYKQKGTFLYYKVREGETLWDIQQHFSYLTIQEIASLNNVSLADNLNVGFVLKIRADN